MIVSDQTIIITGAAGSIGSWLSRQFAADGVTVIAVDMNENVLTLFEGESQIHARQCDLSDATAVAAMVKEVFDSFSPTVLISNAGLIHSEPVVNLLKRPDSRHDAEAWNRTIQSNLNTTFLMGAAVAEQMVKKRIKGLIINMSSIAAHGNLGQPAYSAAKAGIEAMTVTWAKELGMFGIRANAVAPGFFDTSSTAAALSESVISSWIANVPLKRLGKPEELYSAFHFIISNDYYNAQVLEINGGLRI